MIEGELLLAGTDWRTLTVRQFSSVTEALLARVLGGWDAFHVRMDEALSESRALKVAARKGRKVKGRPRVLSLEAAKRMQADAESFDREIVGGR